MQTLLVVTNKPENWSFLNHVAPVIHASDYLIDEQYHSSKSIRIINLCDSYDYQNLGYYVSLLAQARDHRAIPSISNIQDTLSTQLAKQISEDIEEEIQHNLQQIQETEFILNVYFGHTYEKRFAVLAKKLNGLFPLPLLRFTFEKKKHWSIKKLNVLSITDVPENDQAFIQQSAENYLNKKRFYQWRKKQRYHQIAILVEPYAQNTASNKKALDFFINAGESLGLNVDLIDKNDFKFIAEYDALFIRATTAVNHYTYRFSRRAAQENLVVIDDPQSIVRCSNKVYLAELLRSHQILTPQTTYISKHDNQLPSINFPCILKKPDGAFSQGVVKIDTEQELKKVLKQFFKTSELVLIQPFIPTAFDWRIGVLDHKPLYASRYYMAKGHWQINNWNSQSDIEGDDESVPLNEVPANVIKTALKASRLIGDGLYGVDIKTHNDKHYVIEINDNPSIDYGVEDSLLGESLYAEIMSVFLQRIRKKHGYIA